MRTLSRYILCLCLLTLGGTAAFAQQEEKFDASRYSMQRRHVNRSERFTVGAGFFENTFVSVYSGASQAFKDDRSSYSMGPVAGVAIGKWFSDVSGIRLDAYGNTFMRNYDSQRLWTYGADASYLHNIVFNPRFFNLNLLAGAGYRKSVAGLTESDCLSAHVGLNLGIRIWENTDLYFEPTAGFLTDFSAGDSQWKPTRFAYGMNFGVSYNFLPEEVEYYKPSYEGRQFVSIMGSAQFQLSDLVLNNIGIENSLGPHIAVSYGNRYNDLFTLRASLFYANDIYAKYMDSFRFRTHYYGARVEAMFEFLHFIRGHSAEKFGISLMAGPEVGGLHKTDLNETIDTAYLGLTGGLQINFKLAGPVSMFLEPRFSMIPYSFKPSYSVSTTSERVNYIDMVTSVNLGVSYRL